MGPAAAQTTIDWEWTASTDEGAVVAWTHLDYLRPHLILAQAWDVQSARSGEEVAISPAGIVVPEIEIEEVTLFGPDGPCVAQVDLDSVNVVFGAEVASSVIVAVPLEGCLTRSDWPPLGIVGALSEGHWVPAGHEAGLPTQGSRAGDLWNDVSGEWDVFDSEDPDYLRHNTFAEVELPWGSVVALGEEHWLDADDPCEIHVYDSNYIVAAVAEDGTWCPAHDLECFESDWGLRQGCHRAWLGLVQSSDHALIVYGDGRTLEVWRWDAGGGLTPVGEAMERLMPGFIGFPHADPHPVTIRPLSRQS